MQPTSKAEHCQSHAMEPALKIEGTWFLEEEGLFDRILPRVLQANREWLEGHLLSTKEILAEIFPDLWEREEDSSWRTIQGWLMSTNQALFNAGMDIGDEGYNFPEKFVEELYAYSGLNLAWTGWAEFDDGV